LLRTFSLITPLRSMVYCANVVLRKFGNSRRTVLYVSFICMYDSWNHVLKWHLVSGCCSYTSFVVLAVAIVQIQSYCLLGTCWIRGSLFKVDILTWSLCCTYIISIRWWIIAQNCKTLQERFWWTYMLNMQGIIIFFGKFVCFAPAGCFS
jgi:hypothetical protein